MRLRQYRLEPLTVIDVLAVIKRETIPAFRTVRLWLSEGPFCAFSVESIAAQPSWETLHRYSYLISNSASQSVRIITAPEVSSTKIEAHLQFFFLTTQCTTWRTCGVPENGSVIYVLPFSYTSKTQRKYEMEIPPLTTYSSPATKQNGNSTERVAHKDIILLRILVETKMIQAQNKLLGKGLLTLEGRLLLISFLNEVQGRI